MIVRANKAVSFLIEFPSGHPDGNVVWTLRGPDTLAISTGTVVVPANAVSVNIQIPAIDNAILGYNSYRDLEWTYSVGGLIFNGETRYSIEARVPFGASPAGVRTKLGIDDPVDLPDDEISLVTAYLDLLGKVDPSTMPADSLVIRNAIEALAALALIPSLVVRLAKKEDSGTSSFQRQDIDWAILTASLTDMVMAAIVLVDPTFNPIANYESIFILASPETDAITGA